MLSKEFPLLFGEAEMIDMFVKSTNIVESNNFMLSMLCIVIVNVRCRGKYKEKE